MTRLNGVICDSECILTGVVGLTVFCQRNDLKGYFFSHFPYILFSLFAIFIFPFPLPFFCPIFSSLSAILLVFLCSSCFIVSCFPFYFSFPLFAIFYAFCMPPSFFPCTFPDQLAARGRS